MEAINEIKAFCPLTPPHPFCITAFLILKFQNGLVLTSSSTVVFVVICYLVLHSEMKNNLISFLLLLFFSFQFPSTSNYPRKSTLVPLSISLQMPLLSTMYPHTTQLILWTQTYFYFFFSAIMFWREEGISKLELFCIAWEEIDE